MCYIQVIHFTKCETRRQAIINAVTGQAVYHPLEPPPPCEHHDPYGRTECPYHGLCCKPGQIAVCYAKKPNDVCRGWQAYHRVIHPMHMDTSDLPYQMKEIEDWDELECNTDIFAYEEDIRGQFFDVGASMYELATQGDRIVQYVLNRLTNSAQEEANLVQQHGALYNDWMIFNDELSRLTEAWEILASVGSMEVCPASLLRVHPWRNIFQDCLTRRTKFRQFNCIPFQWLDNIELQDDILHWHPSYRQRRPPSPPREPSVDLLLQSPYSPRRREAEIQARVEAQNQPYPGDWTDIIDQVPRQQQASTSVRRASAALTREGAPSPESIPSPYSGSASHLIAISDDEDSKDEEAHGDQPTTPIGPPQQSPTAITREVIDLTLEESLPMANASGNPSPGEIPPGSAASTFVGIDTPPHIIPYGQEPDMDWKEVYWNQPATTIDSPKVSPTRIPHVFAHPSPAKTPPTVNITSYDGITENPLDDEFDEWCEYDFVGTEEPAAQEFLHVPAPFKLEPAPRIPSWRTKGKRRWSDIVKEAVYEDFERQVKRRRIC
ncbi:hypothetical protein F53441_5543 [Fusarium austroafricanum]|uniref:Uncharacterized protein n=1 Tax=Fusarium austroafricanum TaxID=2364996 RepID=A0A8H4KKH8_9HYPO|nr:hypothetical protein F53441_5543 [Fusarium austroafricanum]